VDTISYIPWIGYRFSSGAIVAEAVCNACVGFCWPVTASWIARCSASDICGQAGEGRADVLAAIRA